MEQTYMFVVYHCNQQTLLSPGRSLYSGMQLRVTLDCVLIEHDFIKRLNLVSNNSSEFCAIIAGSELGGVNTGKIRIKIKIRYTVLIC